MWRAEILSRANFHRQKSSKDSYQARCKTCNQASVLKWQAENRDKYLTAQRANTTGGPAELTRDAAGLNSICSPVRWMPGSYPAAGARLSWARATGGRPARSWLSRVRCAWSA
jgi:hypothetical protein